MIRLDGGSPTLGDGLRIANGRIGTILGYAVISATVGVILRAIQERVGFIGRLIAGLLGAGWAVATFLVVPVIVTSDRGAIELDLRKHGPAQAHLGRERGRPGRPERRLRPVVLRPDRPAPCVLAVLHGADRRRAGAVVLFVVVVVLASSAAC